MRFLALVLALTFATASAGCAMIAAKAPDPERRRDQAPMCNDGRGGVVVDGMMATALGIATLGLASDGEGEGAAITGLGALIYGISAGVGSSSARKCREANEEFAAIREQEAVEAAFMQQGGGAVDAPGSVPSEEEDAAMASIPPPKPRPPVVVAAPQPQPQPKPQPQPQPQPPPSSRPQPASSGDDGDWSEFWKEVP